MSLMYYACTAGVGLARVLPRRVCYFISHAIASAYFLLSGAERTEMAENIRIVRGGDVTPREDRTVRRRIFVNFAKYLADFFKFPVVSREKLQGMVEVHGREHLEDCLDRGKGAILLSVHLGNWELGAAFLGTMGYPMNALVLRHADERVDAFFETQRRMSGMNTIPLGFGVKRGFAALKRNEFLAIVADKDYTGNGIEVDFFGRVAALPKGPAVLALRTGAPILFTVLIRNPDDTFRLVMEPPVFPERKDKVTPEDIKGLMSRYIPYFEKYIYDNLEQWYAFKRIWKPQPKTR